MQSDDQPPYSALRFMGSQRVRHDWATELNWTELNSAHSCHHDLDGQSGFFPSLHAAVFLQEICAHVGCDLRRQFRKQLSEVAEYGYAQYPQGLNRLEWWDKFNEMKLNREDLSLNFVLLKPNSSTEWGSEISSNTYEIIWGSQLTVVWVWVNTTLWLLKIKVDQLDSGSQSRGMLIFF